MTTVNTFLGLNWVYLAVKMTGYSSTPLIVTLLPIPEGVRVSEEVCTEYGQIECLRRGKQPKVQSRETRNLRMYKSVGPTDTVSLAAAAPRFLNMT